MSEFLRALVLAVAPAIAPTLVDHALKRRSEHRDVKPENVSQAEPQSFRAYVARQGARPGP